MPFEWVVALRFLREGRFQTWLIIGGATVGVAVVIFITALVNGLQANTIRRTLGTQAHIVVRPLEEVATAQRQPEAGAARRPGPGAAPAGHASTPHARWPASSLPASSSPVWR